MNLKISFIYYDLYLITLNAVYFACMSFQHIRSIIVDLSIYPSVAHSFSFSLYLTFLSLSFSLSLSHPFSSLSLSLSITC